MSPFSPFINYQDGEISLTILKTLRIFYGLAAFLGSFLHNLASLDASRGNVMHIFTLV